MKMKLILALTLLTTASAQAQLLKKPSSKEIVATTLIREAGGEKDPRAMRAVYEVINNRAQQQHKPCATIVLQPKQFSCWNDYIGEQRVCQAVQEAKAHARYTEALRIASGPCDTDYTRGATFYHATRVTPYWSASFTKTVTIEKHVFYIGR